MSTFEFEYGSPIGWVSIHAVTYIRMGGGDTDEFKGTAYTTWLIFISEDGEGDGGKCYTVAVYPLADDGTSEYDTPYYRWEYDEEDGHDFTSDVFDKYEQLVVEAMGGVLEEQNK
jgi:hypothetical protein